MKTKIQQNFQISKESPKKLSEDPFTIRAGSPGKTSEKTDLSLFQPAGYQCYHLHAAGLHIMYQEKGPERRPVNLFISAVPAAENVSKLTVPAVPDHTDKSGRTAGRKKDKSILQKKAWAKYKTVESVLELIALHSPFEKEYWDTFHCCEKIKQEGQYITGSYCGHGRWCRVCGRIVEAKLIQAYKPVLATFQHPMFVTLTIVNVTEPELRPAIQKMTKTLTTINHLFRHERPYRIIGIRKIEVEPSEHLGEYHPQLHLIIEGRCVADALVEEWLIRYPTANIRGQDITPCTEGSLAELFKYVTKPVVKTSKQGAKTKNHTAYQLDVIYRALDKKRIFQPIGIKKSVVKEDVEGILSQKIPDLKFLPFEGPTVWNWNQEARDWISPFGSRLSGYRQNKEIPGFVPTVGYHRRN